MANRLRLLSFLALLAQLSAAGCYGYRDRGAYYGGGTNGGSPSVNQGGTPRVGEVCDPNASAPAQGDPCASAGLSCTPLLVDGGFTCQLPGELYGCSQSVGCASGLTCQVGYCLQACATTADCTDPLTICAPYMSPGGSVSNQCLLNECEGRDGFGLWQVCSAASADGGDGTCVPLDASAGRSGCQQAGAVALGGACQFDRADGGPGFCAVGLICMVDEVGDNRGLCMSVCDGFGGSGPTCPSGTSCVVTTLPLPPPAVSAVEYYSDTGACAQTCVPSSDAGMEPGATDGGVADGGCPAPTSCVNGSITSTADDVCLP